jgi:hypothetical protein
MDNRTLVELAQALQGKAPQEVDDILRRQHLDVVERIAVKHQLAGMGGRTVRARFELATDTASYAPPQARRSKTTLERLLDRLGVDTRRTYSEAELTARLREAGLDAEQRLAVKIEAEARGLLRHASVAARLLEHLGLDGPVDAMALECLLDRRGVGSVTLRTAIRAELQQRGWLRGGTRTLRASAAPGTRLVDSRGRTITLKSRP